MSSLPPQPTSFAPTGPSGPAGRRPPSRRPDPARARAERGDLARARAERPDGNRAALRRAVQFATLLLEVEAGLRDARQLAVLTTPGLWSRLAALDLRTPVRGRVEHVLGARTARTRFDAVLVVRRESRHGALALGLVHSRDDWRVHQAGRPEDRPRPVPGQWPMG